MGTEVGTEAGTEIREMTAADHTAVRALWRRAEGVGLSDADTPSGVARFLTRNPGHSLVALDGEPLVAAVLCGHDGRRGYVHHLAVDPACRRRGIARELLTRCLAQLRESGIRKCHIFVMAENAVALSA